MQSARWVLALAIATGAATASGQVYHYAPQGYSTQMPAQPGYSANPYPQRVFVPGSHFPPPVRVQRYTPDGYPIRPDGYSYCTGAGPCGPRGLEWLIPQGFSGADFRPACSLHDRCYTMPGISRRYCDRQFHRGLLNSCRNSRHPILCRLTAHTMFGLTRLFGGPAFRASQRGWYR